MKKWCSAIVLFLVFQVFLPVFAVEPVILKVGIYQNEPKIFLDARGKPAGLWVDLLEHISAKEGWRLTYVTGTWQQCLDRLEKGEIDILPDVAFTEKRSRIYQFNKEMILANWAQVYGSDSQDIENIEDLKYKKVAVMKGDISFERFKLFNIPCTFVICEDFQGVIQAVDGKKADAGIVSRLYGLLYENQYRVKRTSIVLAPAELRFAFPMNSDVTYAVAIDRHLAELKNEPDSFYNRTLDKWFSERVVWSIPKEFKFAFSASVILVVLFFISILLLRKRVRRTTRELEQSERLYRTHFENASDVIYSVGSDFKLLTVSPSIERILGYKPEELEGRRFSELNILAPEYLSQATDDMMRILKGERIHAAIYEFISKSGERRFGEVSGSPLFRDNKVIANIAVARDISERLRSEKLLRDAYKRFLTILDSIDAHIYVADMDTHEILFINKLMTDTFGEDLTGQICHRVFRNEIAPCSCCTNPQLVDEKGKPKGLLVWENQNPVTGKWYINHDRAIEWIDGRVVRLQVATDISWKKDLDKKGLEFEKRLAQAQKMEAIGTLAGGIAHDFNNILSAIIGYTELAQMKIDAASEIKGDLKEVLTAGERAKDLVRQILAFSRQGKEDQMLVQVGLIVKEALKLLRASLPTTIDFRQNIRSHSVTLIDPTNLHQIVMNLCTNAAYSMRENGGILEITLTDVELDSDFCSSHPNIQPGAYQKLTVSDTGHGMIPEVMSKIFDPFFSTKPKNEGTGLGLSVVHGIIEKCGGTITVYSEPDKITTFNLYFPIVESTLEEKAEIYHVIPTGSEHILFVDDEKPIGDIAKKIFTTLGYTVDIRTSSLEALELFKAMPDKFDLVITDMTMPQMTGDMLARELLKIRPKLPVVICTGFSENITKRKADTIGIKALLMKPLLKEEMAHTIRKLLDETKGSTS